MKEALRDLLKVSNALGAALDDGKVSIVEAVDLIIKSASIIDDIQNAKEIYEEWKSLSAEEKQELAEYFAEEFDIPNDRVEVAIEKVVIWLLSLEDVINAVKGIEGPGAVTFSQPIGGNKPPKGV